MARFRRGDLILNQDQKISIGDADITYDGSTVDINKSVKSEGLKIGDGEITSISNSPSSDSTSELMTSAATQDAIDDAVAGFSGGVDQLEAILQPVPEIVASKLVSTYQPPSNATVSNFTHDTSYQYPSFAMLKSGLIAIFTKDNADYATVYYYKQDGSLLNSLNVFTGTTGQTILSYSTLMGSTSSGKLLTVMKNSSTGIAYLLCINEDCTKYILEAISGTIVSCGVLPDDTVVTAYVSVTDIICTRYSPDFDSTSFTVISGPTTILDVATYTDGNTIKFFKENKIVIPASSGFNIIDLSSFTKVFSTSGYGTLDSQVLVTVEGNILLVNQLGSELYGFLFDENGNLLVSETALTNDHYQAGPSDLVNLPNGNIMMTYLADGSPHPVNYVILDSFLNIIESSTNTTIIGSDSQPCLDITSDGKIFIGVRDNNIEASVNILNFKNLVVSGMSFSDDTYFDGVSTDTWVEDDKIVSSDTIVSRIGSYNNKVSPRTKQPYLSGNEIFCGEYEYSPPLLSGKVGNLGSFSTYYYTAAIMNNDNNLVVMYQTASLTLHGAVLNGETFETISDELIDVPSGMSSTLNCYGGALLTHKGDVISVFSTGSTPAYPSILVGVRPDGTIVQSVQSSYCINGVCVLDNDDIFVVRYSSSTTENQYARYRIENDSTSFVVVQPWTNFTTTVAEFGGSLEGGETSLITPLDNDHFLVPGGLGRSFIIDLKGEGYSIAHSSFSWSGNLYCFDDKIMGVGNLNSIASAIVLDKQFNLLKSEALNYSLTVARGGPDILPNGDIVFVYGGNSQHRTVIFKSNGDIEELNSNVLFNYSPYTANICSLNDGSFMIIDYYNTAALYLHALIYKKVTSRIAEKPDVTKFTSNENRGTYNFKTTKYIPKLLYSAAGAGSERAPCFLNNGKLVVIDSITDGAHYNPVLTVFDTNDNLIIERQALDFSELENGSANIGNVTKDLAVFYNKPWFACAFYDNSTGYYGLHIYDEEGTRVCYPFLSLHAGVLTFTILNDDTILLFENYNYSDPPSYYQGRGFYVSRVQADVDSSSFIVIESPRKTTAGGLSAIEFNSKSLIYLNSGAIYIADKNTGTTKGYYASFYDELTGTSGGGQFGVVDDKIFSFTSWDASLNGWISFWEWNEETHDITFIKEYQLENSGGSGYKVQTMPDGYGNILLPVYDGYNVGIRIMDQDGNYLEESDYIYPGPSPSTAVSNSRFIYSPVGGIVEVGQMITTSYVTRWKPVIKMTSPLVSTLDVNTLVDETSSTLVLTSNNLGQLIVNADTTAQIINIPADSEEDLPIGFKCMIARLSTGDVTVTASGGVTLLSVGSNVSLRVAGSTATLTKIAADTWQLSGDLD